MPSRRPYRPQSSGLWVWPVGIVSVIGIVGILVWAAETNPLEIG